MHQAVIAVILRVICRLLMSRVPFSCLRDSRHHSRFVLNTMKRQAAEADDFGPGFEEVGAYPEAPAHIIKKARLEALLEQPVHFPGTLTSPCRPSRLRARAISSDRGHWR